MLPGGIPGRRTKPKAFSRPSIEVSRHGREWRDDVPAKDLLSGDIVEGFGKLKTNPILDSVGTCLLINVAEDHKFCHVSLVVKAFVLKDEV